MLTTIRRGGLQKKSGGDLNKAEGNKIGTIAVVRSSVSAPEDCKGKGGPGKKSKTKAHVEAKSPMSTYSFADYHAPSPSIVYTRCEDEANRLVQTLDRYVNGLLRTSVPTVMVPIISVP